MNEMDKQRGLKTTIGQRLVKEREDSYSNFNSKKRQLSVM